MIIRDMISGVAKKVGLLKLKPVVFLHLQKTAGTSIINAARQFYGNDNVISHGDYCFDLSGERLDANKYSQPEFMQSRFGHIDFVSGHFGYDFAKQFMSERYSFTFLRNPVERVLSFYYFCRTRNPKQFKTYEIAQNSSLDEFLELGFTDADIRCHILNHQVAQLATGWGSTQNLALTDDESLELAIQHLNHFSYVGFTETFGQDQTKILNDIGIKMKVCSLTSNSTAGRPVFDGLPKSSKDLLMELTRLDRILYEKAWSMSKRLN